MACPTLVRHHDAPPTGDMYGNVIAATHTIHSLHYTGNACQESTCTVPYTKRSIAANAAVCSRVPDAHCAAASQLIKCKPDNNCSYQTSRAVSLNWGPVGAFSVPEHFREAGYCWFCCESTTIGFSLDLHKQRAYNLHKQLEN
jgi:hypothetical protein